MSKRREEDTEREDTRKPGKDRVDDTGAADTPPPTPPTAPGGGQSHDPKKPEGNGD